MLQAICKLEAFSKNSIQITLFLFLVFLNLDALTSDLSKYTLEATGNLEAFFKHFLIQIILNFTFWVF